MVTNTMLIENNWKIRFSRMFDDSYPTNALDSLSAHDSYPSNPLDLLIVV